jgi:large subunit ribosomal protein L23
VKDPRDIIRRPVFTEATTKMMDERQYVFEVDVHANKVEVKKAIEAIFAVKVEKVNTLRVLGKEKRHGRYSGRRPERKKAIVKLTQDSKPIGIFES